PYVIIRYRYVLFSHSSYQHSPTYTDLHSFPTRRSSDLHREWRLRDTPRTPPRIPALPATRRCRRVARSVGTLRHRATRRHRLVRSEEHTSELQSRVDLVCRLLLEKKKKTH